MHDKLFTDEISFIDDFFINEWILIKQNKIKINKIKIKKLKIKLRINRRSFFDMHFVSRL